LVIYFGAGVTLSETGMTWAALTTELIRKFAAAMPEKAADRESLVRFARTIPPLHQASILMELYSRKLPEHAHLALVVDILSLIYRGRNWRSGEYTKALTLLCDALVKANRSISLYTTNYDTFLETTPKKLKFELPSLQIDFYGVDPANVFQPPPGPDHSAEESVRVEHVHGLIVDPATYQEFTPAAMGRVSPPFFPVFSERDYHNRQDDVVKKLAKAFDGSNVLILGSGLDDPPLLRALAQVESRRRWAVFPRAALVPDACPFDVSPAESEGDVVRILKYRASQFGIELIVPDFFSQAAQFVREVACAVGDPTYETEPATGYMMRLRHWWNRWNETHLGIEEMAVSQAQAHEILAEAIPEVQALAGNLLERMKLEFWVRIPDDRNMLLWASSTGTWPNPKTARVVPITMHSDYAAVQAFVDGEVLLSSTGDRSDRWERYLAVPVRQSPDVRFPVVAVITLATANNTKNTTISEENPTVLAWLSRRMRDAALRLLQTELD